MHVPAQSTNTAQDLDCCSEEVMGRPARAAIHALSPPASVHQHPPSANGRPLVIQSNGWGLMVGCIRGPSYMVPAKQRARKSQLSPEGDLVLRALWSKVVAKYRTFEAGGVGRRPTVCAKRCSQRVLGAVPWDSACSRHSDRDEGGIGAAENTLGTLTPRKWGQTTG